MNEDLNCRFRWTERAGKRECEAVICEGNVPVDRVQGADEAETRKEVESRYPGIVYRNGGHR